MGWGTIEVKENPLSVVIVEHRDEKTWEITAVSRSGYKSIYNKKKKISFLPIDYVKGEVIIDYKGKGKGEIRYKDWEGKVVKTKKVKVKNKIEIPLVDEIQLYEFVLEDSER